MSYPPVPEEFLKRERAHGRKSSLLILLVMLGGGVGIFVGVCTSAVLVRPLGQWFYGPKYPEFAFLLSLFGLVVGGVGGAILGCVTAERSPLLFLVTFVPLAVVFVLWMYLARMSKTEPTSNSAVTIGCHQHLVAKSSEVGIRRSEIPTPEPRLLTSDFRPLTSDL